MSDLIRRQDAIAKFKKTCTSESIDKNGIKRGEIHTAMTYEGIIKIIESLPSVEPEQEEFEWCHDCKEYDQEKHCCHRWTKVIRKTVEEVKSQYALEYPKIIHCEDCKFYTPMNRALKTGICSLTMHHLGDDGFCSDAERRGE